MIVEPNSRPIRHKELCLAAAIAVALLLSFPPAALCQEPASKDRQDPTTLQAEPLLAELSQRISSLDVEQARLQAELARSETAIAALEEQMRSLRLVDDEGTGERARRLEAALQDERVRAGEFRERLNHVGQAMMDAIQRQNAAQQQIQRQRRMEELEASQAERETASREAAAVLETARGLASQPNAVEALRRAIAETELQQLKREYEVRAQQSEQLRGQFEMGRVSSGDLLKAQAEAEAALARFREAALRQSLEQVERERGGFAERNQPAEVTGQVLQTEFFRGYLDTVQRYSQLSSDPSNAAVAAVVTAADLLRDKGPQASIEYFEPILRELHVAGAATDGGRAAEAAIRLQLAEAYHAADRDEDALRVLRGLIVKDPERRGHGGGEAPSE